MQNSRLKNWHEGILPPTVPIWLGKGQLPMCALNQKETVEYLIETQSRGKSVGVLTVNWEMISRALLSRGYLKGLSRFSMFTPDGAPLVFLMRMFNKNLSRDFERVPGVDMTRDLLMKIKGTKLTIGIIGGRDLEKSLLHLGFPMSQVGLLWEGGVYPKNHSQIRQLAQWTCQKKIDFLLLALPSQKQVILGPVLINQCPTTSIIGVGGTFDYLGKRKRRAPQWIQDMHLEWFWRLVTETRVAQRYLFLYPLGIVTYLLSFFYSRTRP